ncbi:MAG: hypothetical protein ACYTFO_07560 [Planctomycetota bacterium]
MSDLKEILGFLARWTVLALVVLIGVGIVSVAVQAGGEAVPESAGHLAFGDVLWFRETPIATACYGQTVPAMRGSEEWLIGQAPGEQFALLLMARTMLVDVYATIVRDPVAVDGVGTLRLAGIPYSRRAFQSTDLVALVERPDRAIWLLDSGLLIDDARRRPALAGDLIDLLDREGRAICLFGGVPEDFAATRRVFRALRPEMPLVYTDIFNPIRRHLLGKLLSETGADRGGVFLLTDNLTFATRAARLGVTVHWIAPGTGEPPPPGVVRHASVSKFKESLARWPISQQTPR